MREPTQKGELVMGETIRVRHVHGDRFEMSIRGHSVAVDQPVEDGGDDSAPTPTELFVSSLGACVAFYAGRYLARHHLPVDGLEVHASYSFAARPTRVGDITLQLRLPRGVPHQNRAALLAVASHCTVHNSLEHPPSVHIELDERRTEAA
jgi:putative redox protein